MFAAVRIAAIEIAARQNAFTFGQMNAALYAAYHFLRRRRGILPK
jgi:hypothetical protein